MNTHPRNHRRSLPGEEDEGGRTPFERDRDAILYCTDFRRLDGVTQVIAPGEGHLYHNRLTHSMKVAQVALRLGEKIQRQSPELSQQFGLDPSVVEAAGLAHDLGHPPFGHVAEKSLNKLLVAAGVFDGYEGNAQSFRIVTKLAVRLEDDNGLNLTLATLNAILKYPRIQEVAVEKKNERWRAYKRVTNKSCSTSSKCLPRPP